MTNHASDGINAVANVSPIETKGNWFWKDGKRFLIKGVTYEPRGSGLPSPQSRINPLSHEWLQDLRKDIPFFHRLGINTIFIECAEPTQSPLQAMQLLQNEGIYVLLKLHTSLAPGDASQLKAVDINLERMYSPSEIRKNLTIVRQTAGFSNVLGYTISQSEIWTDATTKLAALHRAAVRDTKLFLRRLGVRPIPVGSSMSSAQMYRLDALRYMTAGSPEERADFMSFGVYDWVGPSGFQMSGYKSLIEAFEAFPVPMFWGEYGASAGRKRVLDEVDCLYSPAMTGVVSGGFLHTYGYFDRKDHVGEDDVVLDVGSDDDEEEEEDDDDDDDDDADEAEEVPGESTDGDPEFDDVSNDGDEDMDASGYDLVEIANDGERVRNKDFELFQQKLAAINVMPPEDVVGSHEVKDYDSWRGSFKAERKCWSATLEDIPSFPLDWRLILEQEK